MAVHVAVPGKKQSEDEKAKKVSISIDFQWEHNFVPFILELLIKKQFIFIDWRIETSNWWWWVVASGKRLLKN